MSSTLLPYVQDSLGGVYVRSKANSVFGAVNCENPQSKQTKMFRNNKTPGLSQLWRPEK